jgi:uncharacterized protein (DUF1778 family)
MAVIEQERVREIGLRLSPEQEEKLERAASLAGQSLDDFAASVLLSVADAAPASLPKTVLSERDFDLFLSLRDSDAAPTPALVKVMAEYQRRLADGSLQVED